MLTVLQELGEVMEPENLAKAARADQTVAYAQRLGFLLERAGFSNLTGPLFQWVGEQKPLPAKLEPAMPIQGSKKDKRWNILVNIDVAGDL